MIPHILVLSADECVTWCVVIVICGSYRLAKMMSVKRSNPDVAESAVKHILIPSFGASQHKVTVKQKENCGAHGVQTAKDHLQKACLTQNQGNFGLPAG
jgi:predicted ATP-grasp superfamily ATP-dependent carboligase